jgi:HPt (histidine-containing phosphotransfer) domain-containing protein
VLNTYLVSLARLREQLLQARAAGDNDAVRLATHTLKSSSASIGALCLSSLCAQAEQAVRDGQLQGLARLLDQLLAEGLRVDAAVRLRLTD